MTDSPALPRMPLRSATLPTRKPTRFAFRPDAGQRKLLADVLGLIDLPAFSFAGELRPEGRHDFRLVADMAAEVVQPCVVTLAPVPASLREQVTRLFQADYAAPNEVEVEIPEDDSEPLPEEIDMVQVAIEALTLALPPFPRATGAELGEAVFGPPGQEPLRQTDLNPFAGLASLAEKLKQKDE